MKTSCLSMALGAVLCLCAGAGVAQVTTPVAAEIVDDGERPEGLISSPYWLRGLHFEAEASDTGPKLVAIAPGDWAGEVVCASGTTIEGRYYTAFQYVLPRAAKGGAIELGYPTSFPEPWSRSTADNSGVVLSKGACSTAAGTGPGSAVAPVVLNGEDRLRRDGEGRAVLVMNIHARNTQEVVATLGDGPGLRRARCNKLDRDDAIKFNFRCTLSLEAGPDEAATLRVTRMNNGRTAPPLVADIALPAR